MTRTPGALTRSALLVLGAGSVLAGCSDSVTGIPAAEPELLRAALGARAFYVDVNSAAVRQVESWRTSRPADAALIDSEIASHPTGVWIGDWNTDVRGDVARVVSAAAAQHTTPVLVAYNIPQRDCGSYSAGGADSADEYRSWISQFASGLGGRPAIVILEPDALASTSCLDTEGREARFGLLRHAVQTLKAENAFVYIDAGHPNWLDPAAAAERLIQAGVELAQGFALNVSNFVGNEANIRYGNEISERTGGARYVIDSSRNGLGSDGTWCNPDGRALGTRPTTGTAHERLDAFLWVKKPGESDGICNGGPAAGQWWADYALGLARRSTLAMASADVAS